MRQPVASPLNRLWTRSFRKSKEKVWRGGSASAGCPIFLPPWATILPGNPS